MKVVHINTYPHGGAASAAARIHHLLIEAGVDSHFLLRDQASGEFRKSAAVPKMYPSRLQRVMSKVKRGEKSDAQFNAILIDAAGLYDLFTSFHTSYRVEKHPLLEDADIIHLHWIADFVNFPTFFSSVSKPIVWTCHDRNPVLGGFHLESDRGRHKDLTEIDLQMAIEKLEILNDCGSLQMVSPSKALSNRLKQTLSDQRIHVSHIMNPIDTGLYAPFDMEMARSFFNLPQHNIIIGFLNNYPDVYHKGADIFWDAVKQLPEENLHVFCNGESKGAPGNSNGIGNLKDEYAVRMFLTAIDALVISSREENLPNLLLESMSCGTPVISTPLGGMKDLIITGENGLLSVDNTPTSMAEAISYFIKTKQEYSSEKIRDFATRNFDSGIISTQYIDLYRSLL